MAITSFSVLFRYNKTMKFRFQVMFLSLESKTTRQRHLEKIIIIITNSDQPEKFIRIESWRLLVYFVIPWQYHNKIWAQLVQQNTIVKYSLYTAHHDRKGSMIRILGSELKPYIYMIDREEYCVIGFLLKHSNVRSKHYKT